MKDRRKILWVEDDHFHLRGLMLPIERAGFTVVAAASYQEAQERFKDEPGISLAIVDLIIPYSDSCLKPPNGQHQPTDDPCELGFAFINWLRAEGFDGKILVVSIAAQSPKYTEILDKLDGVEVLAKQNALPSVLASRVLKLLGRV